jgi:hypothetical protein
MESERTVDDPLGMQNGFVDDFRPPDELCTVLKRKETSWHCARHAQEHEHLPSPLLEDFTHGHRSEPWGRA